MGMTKDEAAEFLSRAIPEKDAPIVLEIINATIKALSLEPQMTPDEMAVLTNEQRYTELTTPRITYFKSSEELNTIFLRFVGNETPLAEALFFPIEAVWSFLDTARNYFDTPGTTLSREEIEKYSFNKAVDMFSIMLRTVHPRILATMTSITEETINEWYRQENERFREYYCLKGVIVPNNEPNILKVRQGLINDYKKDVNAVWERLRKNNNGFQKMRFAEQYQIVFKHWDTISLLFRSKKDWHGYAKMPGFEDTPDDLLEELKGSHHRGISHKALEHAARRVALVNPDCKDERILEKRKAGIEASGFSETTLFKYLDEGKKVIDMVKQQRELEATPDKSLGLAE